MQTQEKGEKELELGFLADSKEWVTGVEREKNLITQKSDASGLRRGEKNI